jgi:hypothetical protein
MFSLKEKLMEISFKEKSIFRKEFMKEIVYTLLKTARENLL